MGPVRDRPRPDGSVRVRRRVGVVQRRAQGRRGRVVPRLAPRARGARRERPLRHRLLPPDVFEATADRFFAEPDRSVDGWETARAAQARIVAAVEQVLAAAPPGDVAIVSHGGVGTLLLCALSGSPITRELDQPGQGHWFAFERESRRVLHGWRPLPRPTAAG